MTIYWRLRDIPELRGVSRSRRRRLWREAGSRSFSVHSMGLRLAVMLAFAGLSILLGHLLWPGWLISAYAIPGILLAGVFNDHAVAQPAARRWLREHAHELDRYASA
ncbi:hypothetical protein [Rhodanobacter sp. PCA2]|uniref:hypothetical protein n=1 Tax=Rhodanobacter sp. PCA2 TaxID=2006117 RepID=UPI0015E719D6|nr:hypothetical protein [Rhodanobacter sp. PCA2]MBA2079217.1 hypothetical protein [Rhodanobacter sp. PCA2]